MKKIVFSILCILLIIPSLMNDGIHYVIAKENTVSNSTPELPNGSDPTDNSGERNSVITVESEVIDSEIVNPESVNPNTEILDTEDPVTEDVDTNLEEPVEMDQEELIKKDGWVNEGNEWFYFENDVQKTGWQLISDEWYYLHPETGAKQQGWILYQDNWYFLDVETGIMKTGWLYYQDNWYYLNNGGVMLTGWIFVNNSWYYCDSNSGIMQTGWFYYQDNWYYLNDGGVMLTGWIFLNNSWYYCDSNSGIMQTGWVFYQNNWYFLNRNSGIMHSGGWMIDQGNWYYIDPITTTRRTGWIHINGNYYYSNPTDGVMQTGWVFYQNKWYFMNSGGVLQKGWLTNQNQRYYLHPETGEMKTGWFIDHSKYYYADTASGIIARNTTINGFKVGNSGVWLPEIVNPNQTYTYEQMASDIALLQQSYPYLIKTEIIGQSVDGRNIYALKVGNGSNEIFLNGSHHAREHMTTNLLMEMIEQYSKSYADETSYYGYNTVDLLNKVSIWFVPMVNPDGVSLVQKGHMSAKNPSYVLKLNNNNTDFSGWKANVRGVDLNRQYPADWENIKGNTGQPSSQNFKGYQPLSEPEAIALYQFTKAHNFKTAVAYHSSGQILYWYFKQASNVYNRDYSLALQYGALTGYSLVAPTSNPSGGGYTDWFIQEMKQPGFTPEISPFTYGKPVPLSNFSSIWQQNHLAGLMLAQDASIR